MAPLRDFTILIPQARLDRAFYERLRASRGSFRLVERFVIPPFEGRGFLVRRGQAFRVVEEEGTQIADLSLWNAHNPRERLSGRTMEIEGWMVRPFTRLWSGIPWLRPMATCLEETVDSRLPETGFCHHWVSTGCCATEWTEMRVGIPGLNSCYVNFLQAVEPFGLGEADLPEAPLGLFQKMRIDPLDGRWYAAPSESQRGDYIEFFAEMDLLVAVTVCPNGDNTRYYSVPGRDRVLPIAVEVYDTGFEPRPFPAWTDWRARWRGRWEPTPEMWQALERVERGGA